MTNVIQQDVDLWEVWIEYDQFHPEYFGTLYIHGEIRSGKKSVGTLRKLDATNGGELQLQLPERDGPPMYTREIFYSEPVRNLNQYTSIAIYADSQLAGSFNDIEIMI